MTLDPVEGVARRLRRQGRNCPTPRSSTLATPDEVAAGSMAGRLLRERARGRSRRNRRNCGCWRAATASRASRVASFDWNGAEIALDHWRGRTRAFCRRSRRAAGKTRLWLARSAFAQPGLDAGAAWASRRARRWRLRATRRSRCGTRRERADARRAQRDRRRDAPGDQGRRAVSLASSRR